MKTNAFERENKTLNESKIETKFMASSKIRKKKRMNEMKIV